MEILRDENLSKYFTIHIGGVAHKLYIPKNKTELKEILRKSGEKAYILSGGSNILMNNEKVYPEVIYMGKCCEELKSVGAGGYYYVGSSVRLQTLINEINKAGFGGIEYLYSVPGLVGGAIVMNAGRGKAYNKSIGDFVVSVDCFDLNGCEHTFLKEECHFAYRDSFFKNNEYVVTGVKFKFDEQAVIDTERAKKERIDYARKRQDNSGFNFGSVFCQCNPKAMQVIKQIGLKSGDISFSRKTNNWIINKGQGTFGDAMKVMNKAKFVNKIFGTKTELEVVIWD